ncbi:MAG: RNA methyltransferase [Promethearchaeota archaeon]
MKKKTYDKDLSLNQESQIVDKYKNLNFTVILVRPENTGNIGSIARVMKNFNFKNLIIFNPVASREDIFSYETQGYAMHGSDIFLNAEIIELDNQKNHFSEFEKLVSNFDFTIATTAKGSSFSNIRRLAIFPEEINIPITKKPLDIAILFGKESRGLTNEEINLADLIIRIPTCDDYPTLNISHACGIILYEIFKKIYIISKRRGEHPVLYADKEDRLMLNKIVRDIIEKLKIRTHKKENVFLSFKNIFGRSFISKKELSLILGVFSKINTILGNLNLYED